MAETTSIGILPTGTATIDDYLVFVDNSDNKTKKSPIFSLPVGIGNALTSNPLSQFASTTSLQLKGVINDETGSGALVFGTSPNITTPTGIVKGDVGLGNVDNTSDATKNSATATLTNKTLTSPVINVTSDATGDIYYRNAGGLFTRLPIGSAGTKLTVASGIPSWVSSDISCRIKQATTQSIGTTLTAVLFDAETYDTDTIHSTVTNTSRITFTRAGKYNISGCFNTDANAISRAGIRLNGTTYIYEVSGGNTGVSLANGVTIAFDYDFVATDYIEMMGYFGTTQNTKTGENGTILCAHKFN